MQGNEEMSDPIQALFGVKLSVLIAAVLGGAVSAILVGGSIWRQTVNTFAGSVTAVYLSPVILRFLADQVGPGEDIEHAIVFVTGLIGMILCETLIRMAQRARSRAPALADKAIDRVIK
jgi:putative effector of murein hydrolase